MIATQHIKSDNFLQVVVTRHQKNYSKSLEEIETWTGEKYQ